MLVLNLVAGYCSYVALLFKLEKTNIFSGPASREKVRYVESFIGKLRDELLNGEIFDTLLEAQVIIESWRKEYNLFRPHNSLGYRSLAPEAIELRALSLQL